MRIYYYGDYYLGNIINNNILVNLLELQNLLLLIESGDDELLAINEEGIVVGRKNTNLQSTTQIPITFDNTDVKQEEVSREFYILWEFLPEHIKKELKIYVKKTVV